MPRLRISVVQYLNTAPLVYGFTHGPLRGKYELSFTVPSECAEALRSGAVDVAIIPSIEYQRIDGLTILPDLCVSSKRQSRSLLIISKVPIQEARQIALDRSSRTTQALTKILCDKRWQIAPEFYEAAPDLTEMLKVADAALLIGDPALRLAIAIKRSAHRGTYSELVCKGADARIAGAEMLHVYDVVEEWRKMTGLPAVLAVWAARVEVVTPELIEDFHASLKDGLAHVREISAGAALQMQLPAKPLERYLRENIDFSLDEENFQGLVAYYVACARMGLISRTNSISVAARAGKPARYVGLRWANRAATP